MTYYVIKRYGHEEGLSVAFRQWKAKHSHCKFIHGYSLAFEFKFACEDLDARDWCIDFGGLKQLKQWLKDSFDHKFFIAEDDPNLVWFQEGGHKGIFDMKVVPHVSCEYFAALAFTYATHLIEDTPDRDRVRLISVKVCEHPGNSVIYEG